MVDVVTERSGNLCAELLDLLEVDIETKGQDSRDLYASANRSLVGPNSLTLETWSHALALDEPLPTLPLWIQPDLCLPLDLEAAYQSACLARRIAPRID